MSIIAITGATGQLGQLVVGKLLEAGVLAPRIIAVVRNTSKAKSLGVPVRLADYNDLGALTAAFDGVSTVVLISSNEIGKRTAQHANVISAAKAAGVRRLVYTSVLQADTTPLSCGAEHRDTEHLIKASGLPFTLLRNGWYTENYTMFVPSALEHGAVLGCARDARISGAARADYADAIVSVVTAMDRDAASFANATLELAGDSSFTLTQLAAELSAQTGHTIPYVDLTQAQYVSALEKAGVPPMFAALVADWDVGAQTGALFDESNTLSSLIGHRTTPLRALIADAIAAYTHASAAAAATALQDKPNAIEGSSAKLMVA